MAMKPIETKYKGHHFRSRLEARWAVYFDVLGYEWEYEPEGFELEDGTRYLPDFRISMVDTNGDSWVFWFEVKPENGSSIKAEKFADNLPGGGCSSDGIVILLDGAPVRNKKYRGLGSNTDASWWLRGDRGRPWHDDQGNLSYEDAVYYGKVFDDVRAVEAARSARFEHGQSGAYGVWVPQHG